MSLIPIINKITWKLSDLVSIPPRGIKVMSTFACGGGSSLGYKRAGCDIIAANDIDPEMAWHYQKNINARSYLLAPIGQLISKPLPNELFQLDILDGSPPCSTFSMAGSREASWGKEKYFREGQHKQVLSDLFFDYLNLVKHLRPKVAIAENVKGMLFGNAKGYTKLIMTSFREMGYRPQLFLINAADCGVPQRRERVFFCALRNDLSGRPLNLNPQHRWISAAEALSDLTQLTDDERQQTRASTKISNLWHSTRPGDSLDKAFHRQIGRSGYFSYKKLRDDQPALTLTATDTILHWNE